MKLIRNIGAALFVTVALAHSATREAASSAAMVTMPNLGSESSTAPDRRFAIPFERLTSMDIAHMNLLCAEGLSGAEGMKLESLLAGVEEWANQVRVETRRHEYRFKRNPAEFENSEGFFKMLMLAVVLAEDFHVRYNPTRRVEPSAVSANDHFFADSRDVFLHGSLGPERRGTCSPLPVLYVAIGRRLGYPLKLVTTKGHLFVRWEGAGERFNVEAAGEGLNRFDDDYYRKWPFAITPEEEEAEGYLKSLCPSEELAVFLSVRVQCLKAAKAV